MSSLIDLAAERIADEWCADLPVGHLFAPIVSRGTGAVLAGVVAWTARRVRRNIDQTARLMFAVPDAARSASAAAEHIAQVVLGWLPPDLRSAGAAARAREKPPAGAPGGEPDAQSAAEDALRQVLAALDARPELSAAAADVRAFASTTLVAAAGGPRSYDPERIIREMTKLARRLARFSPRVNRLLHELEREALELPQRFAIATAIAAVDLADLRTTSSTPAIGNAVHRKLRERYQASFPGSTIVSEGRVYTPGKPAGTPLARAAVDKSVPYADYTIYRLSRFSIFSPRRGNLRDDLVDFWEPLRSHGRHWEIKPAAGAPEGVVQAAWYRFAYNVWAIFAEDTLHLPMRTRRIGPGRSAPLTAHGVTAAFPLPGNGAFQVVPVAIDALGDLIVYWIVEVRGLLPELVAVLSATILALIREALKQARKALDQLGEWGAAAWAWLKELAETIAEFIQEYCWYLVAALAILALAILFWPVVAGAAAAAAGTIAAGAAAAATVLVVAGAIIILFPEEPARQDGPTIAPLGVVTPRERDPRVTATFGSCTLVDVPVSTLAQIRAGLGPLMKEAAAALAAAFPPAAPTAV